MKKVYYLFFVTIAVFLVTKLNAQCPVDGSVTGSTTSSPTICGGDGTITVTFDNVGDISLQLWENGSINSQIVPPEATSPYTWSGLGDGDYEVRIVCAEDVNTIYQTLTETVGNGYTPISNADITVTGVCDDYTPGGTINIGTITGGTAPYEYKIVQSDNPAFPESEGTYTNSTTYDVSDFGDYQIRIKDACGNYVTYTINIASTLPVIEWHWRPRKQCDGTVRADWNYTVPSGIAPSQVAANPIHLTIRTGSHTGPIIYDGDYNADPFVYPEDSSHTYYVTSTNKCGQSVEYVVDLSNPNSNNPELDYFTASSSTSGCAGVGVGETMTISLPFGSYNYWAYPVTITVADTATGVVEYTGTQNDAEMHHINGLPMGTYDVTVTDSCGDSYTVTIDDPQGAGNPELIRGEIFNWNCTTLDPLTQTGTYQTRVRIIGYLPDTYNAVVTIIAGPSNVGVEGVNSGNGAWSWSNLMPGTYTFQFGTCDTVYTQDLTFPPHVTQLEQSIVSTGTSFCSGGGTITSDRVYNGAYPNVVELLDASGTVIDSNYTGSFSNLSAGTYTTRLKITPCEDENLVYYIEGNEVVLTNAITGPVISSLVSVVCEDSEGTPLSTGSLYLNLAGVEALDLKYRLEGETTWNTIFPAPTEVTIEGLLAHQTYELELADGCGGNISTTAQISTIGSINATNTVHPCYDTPYSLEIPSYAGATYEWTNPLGVVVSTDRIYPIANYDSSYNGTYTCKISWSDCVERYVTITINGDLCGNDINEACYNDPNTSVTTGLETYVGISTLGRGSQDTSTWPMERNSGHIVLESNAKGFIITRMATSDLSNITTPQEGMMVYDTTEKCLKIYSDDEWKCFNKPACP